MRTRCVSVYTVYLLPVMKSGLGNIDRKITTRKRPHVSLQYEDTREIIAVKQEFCSSLTPCQFMNDKEPTEPSQSEQMTCGQDTFNYVSVPPLYPPFISTQTSATQQLHNNLVKLESQHCRKTVETFNGGPYPYHAELWPIPEQAFPPWGLAPASESSGSTFGTLAGIDMSKSLEEGEGLSEYEKKATPTKGKSPRGRSRMKREEEEDDGWEPPLWRQQLQNISKMREIRDAPVDLMGAHKNAEQTTHVPPEVRRYQVLVSLMLSSQTKDQITARAMQALKSHGLTIENMIKTPEEDIAQLIHPVGFWRKKAGYIKRVSQILLDKYSGDIPATMDQLCSLPGVGPKMSHLVMDIAWDHTSGIAVDTHVHRISHRLGWIRKPTENPEVTRICLEKWLPKSEWRELNWLLVGFGQQRCLPNGPKCHGCLNEDICPASKLKGGGPWGKKRKTIKKET